MSSNYWFVLKFVFNLSSYVRHVDTNVAYDTMTLFEFIIILCLKKEMMGIIDCIYCYATSWCYKSTYSKVER
ncbi:hypothetical protein Lal_00028163 [Lupinus albus]|nr:hypothetical protein Lal_00028163 [Lupinus albus]